MKFNFRKIASVLAGTVMLSSTLAFAAAANYPAPFVQGGNADVAIVYGSNAAITDLVAVSDIQSDLQTALAEQTAVAGSSTGATASGGDAVNIGAAGSQKLYYGDALNAGITSLSSSNMPNVLADGKFTDLKGTEYTYTQSLTLGNTVSAWGTSGGDLYDPTLYLDVGTDATDPLYTYSISLNKNLNVSDDTNVQGQKINLLGIDYVVGASSTNTTLYLFGSGQTVTLDSTTSSQTVTIGGVDHTVQLVAATGTTTAKLTVDGVSKTVTKGSSYSFTGDLNVYVKDVTYQQYAGGVQSVDLIIGANTLQLSNGATVKKGADATSIQGTVATLKAAGPGQISGFSVNVSAAKSQNDSIGLGQSFSDPVFGGLNVQLADVVPGLNDSSRASVVVDTDNNQYARVTFTSARAGTEGEKQLIYTYDNNTASTAVQPLLAHQTITSNNRGNIRVFEGENANINDWIVVNQGDAGTILNVDDMSVDSATSGSVTFSDAITGESQKVTLTNSSGLFTKSGVNFFGGNGYTIDMNQAGTAVNVTWNSGSTRALFPRIKLANGGWIAFLTREVVNNGTSLILPNGEPTLITSGDTFDDSVVEKTSHGINWTIKTGGEGKLNITSMGNPSCNFNVTMGPAILYLEPKKWNDGSYGNWICIPMTTTGSKEIAIGDPLFNGTNSGFQTYNSDTYKKAAIDQFGVVVTKEDRTNENGVATLAIPATQMALDVVFSAPGATVIPGSSNGGTVKSLGSVIASDSEAASVAGKNLIVVGGSCVNSVAAQLLGSATPMCGSAWETATGVGAGSFLIQTFSQTGGKVATLVAGYNAADTTKAAKALTTQVVDTTAGKKYTGTVETAITLATTAATTATA